MFGCAWCHKGTRDIMEAAIKVPSIRVSRLLISVIRTVTIGPVDAVDQALCARSTVPTRDPTLKQRAKTYNFLGFYFHKLTSVIKAAFEGPLAEHFHFSPYKLFHRSPVTGEDERIFCEVYDLDTFAEAHEEVQRHGRLPPDNPGCKREKVVAALMFWSDSTHLTDFGTAKIWPIYLLFGNVSKYIRMRPTSGACHHLAYIPSVCTSLQTGLA